ncbi:MAG: GlsB/YeaQ/YmgE family stress response membrane protein [Beijerinckiaceae bacterium]|nr:GlsB/YeaQ/YmgE family stress response membrane protein [Beijerinckiaceae bacterium]
MLDWRRLVPTIALGTVTGFAASLIVGGGGLVRHAVVGVLGMLVGQGLVRLTGWRVRTGHAFLDEAAMAVLGAILVVLLARFIA